MTPTGFRIRNLAIEGFKGFTTRQHIDFEGRHTFLLGSNGMGKSSVVEAIRWGLFGSIGRPNEVVANRGYDGHCRVTLSLQRDGRNWELRRTLIRGASGGSDARLFDDQGQEQTLGNILPQLDSADAGEGTYVVFSSQATQLARQPHDLSPFERTVLHYLGLTHPRALLTQFGDFLEEFQLVEQNLAGDLEELRNDIRSHMDDLEQRRSSISSSPPWEGNSVPSLTQTESKIKDLIAVISGNSGDNSLSGLSLDGLLEQADLAQNNATTAEKLREENQALLDAMAILSAVRENFYQVDLSQTILRDLSGHLDQVLPGSPSDSMDSRLLKLRSDMERSKLLGQIVENALELVQRESDETMDCPICHSTHDRDSLESTLSAARLAQHAEPPSGDTTQRLALGEIEDLLQNREETEARLQNLQRERSDLAGKLAAFANQGLTAPPDFTISDLDKLTDHCNSRRNAIAQQIESKDEWLRGVRSTLSNLRREAEFHQIQRRLKDLRESENRFEHTDRAFRELVQFGESTKIIKAGIEECFKASLQEGLPELSDSLSNVFHALTRHSWYDRLEFNSEELPKLELRVASSKDSSGETHPTGVLNGQAESALALVPYFAFSHESEAPTEVHLVLLDDPTRAFDDDHIDILIERLADIGKYVQLVIASQETERFRRLLPKHFSSSEYAVIEPSGWSYNDGPKLAIDIANA